MGGAPQVSPRDAYLYFVTGRMFYVNLAAITLLSVRASIDRYFSPSFDALVVDLDNALREIDGARGPMTVYEMIDGAYGAAIVALAVWWYVTVRGTAARLWRPLGLRRQLHHRQQYTGAAKVRKDLMLATACVGVGAAILIWVVGRGYAVTRVALERFKL
jgi:hypothetical protein